MHPLPEYRAEPFTQSHRTFLITVALGMTALLATARCLHPACSGHGTHEQLGLPPCTFSVIFGIPCPACGMTTSWAWLTRGNLYMAAQANAGGMLLGIGCMVMAPWFIASALCRRWVGIVPTPSVSLCYALPLMLITFLQWAWHIHELVLR
jgi:hypothetical protein